MGDCEAGTGPNNRLFLIFRDVANREGARRPKRAAMRSTHRRERFLFWYGFALRREPSRSQAAL
ncbi:hypothetical protein B1812_06805 [Methylocystis bryophila]|uniref:Uncharacterized protein n=1 Tax=Methylocystis bryophila TaxID=655015 RepID=A0A1W6MTF9_9HYPH|nr:hypothetical protein B1812_06805 [Methylocystis bryophila]